MTDHEAAAGIAAPAFESLGRGFVDAFNGRDVQALVAVSHEQIALRPSTLVGSRRTYRGHDGLRQWIADLDTANVEFKVRAREIRPLQRRADARRSRPDPRRAANAALSSRHF